MMLGSELNKAYILETFVMNFRLSLNGQEENSVLMFHRASLLMKAYVSSDVASYVTQISAEMKVKSTSGKNTLQMFTYRICGLHGLQKHCRLAEILWLSLETASKPCKHLTSDELAMVVNSICTTASSRNRGIFQLNFIPGKESMVCQKSHVIGWKFVHSCIKFKARV